MRSLNEGGAEKQSVLLAKALSDKWDVKLIILFKEGNLIERAERELDKEVVIFLKGNNYLTKSYYFLKFLITEKFDCLFCYLPSNNILGLTVGKVAGIKHVFGGLRGSKIKSSRIKMITQKILLNFFSTAIISNSEKALKNYSDYGIRKDKIQVIQNAIEIQSIDKKKINSKRINILTVGRFVEEKDYKTALLTMKKLIENKVGSDITYTIVGYGEQKDQIMRLIENFNLQQIVKVIERPPDVNVYYKEADIFLLTSKKEGMPNVIMEAMNWKLPIVSTDVGDICYLVKDRVNGYLCEQGDVQSIANSLSRLIYSSEKRDNFGLKSRKILEDNFSLNKMKNDYEELLKKYVVTDL